MLFNSDLSKIAQEVFLFRKLSKKCYVIISNTQIQVTPSQKFLGLTSEDKFTLNVHLKGNFKNIDKGKSIAFDNVFLSYISTLKYCYSYQIYK